MQSAPREWASRRADKIAFDDPSPGFRPPRDLLGHYDTPPDGLPLSPRTWDPSHGGHLPPVDVAERPMSHEDKRVMQSQLVLLKQKISRKERTRQPGLLRSDSLRNGAAGARGGHRFEPSLYEDDPPPRREPAPRERQRRREPSPYEDDPPARREPARRAREAPRGADPAPPPSYRFDPAPPPPGESLERQRATGGVSATAPPPSYHARDARGAPPPIHVDVDDEEEQPPPDTDMIQCQGCGRSFNEKAYARHAKICKKVFGEKRKAFDSAAARLGDIDDSKASELIANARKIEKEKEKAVNGLKPIKDKKPTKWRLQSEMFRQAIAAARGETGGDTEAAAESQAALQRLQEEDDSVQKCPHCGRSFNPEAAKRHIPICQKAFGTKGGRLKKGGGTQCAKSIGTGGKPAGPGPGASTPTGRSSVNAGARPAAAGPGRVPGTRETAPARAGGPPRR